jgi:hypothetical protein
MSIMRNHAQKQAFLTCAGLELANSASARRGAAESAPRVARNCQNINDKARRIMPCDSRIALHSARICSVFAHTLPPRQAGASANSPKSGILMFAFRLARFPLFSAALFAVGTNALAVSLSDLSNKEASSGLKAALEKGSVAAVAKLGVQDGFLANDKVKIELPGILQQAQPLLQMTGYGARLDELVVSMNRAAEKAVPLAKPLLLNAVKSMSVDDAKNILSGGETSVTDFFRAKTSDQLALKFLPIVKGITDKSGLATRYNSTVASVSKFNVVPQQQSTVEGYVTQRALDGLFLMIAEEEKAIRADPIGSGSKILRKVFGSMQ